MSQAQVFGDYAIVKQIGAGPLGRVLLAEHRFLKSPFALKVLPEELATDRGFVSRFEKEVEGIATLEHPHIVKTHNVCFADGHYFLVTDCVVDSLGETTNLAEYLGSKPGPLSEDEVVKIVHQIAFALDYAHQKKVGDERCAHFGIKLNNVLVGTDRGGINVQLSDFGLSRVIGAASLLSRTYKTVSEIHDRYFPEHADLAKLSKLQLSFLQNYAFLAPEQKDIGNLDLVDYRADIYAFGVLVYYLIMRMFPEGFFDMPSMRFPKYRLNWDLLIYHCMQMDPNKRPASLKVALEELLAATTPQDAVSCQIQAGPLKPVLKPQEIVRPEYEEDPGAIFQTESVVARYQPMQAEERVIEPLLSEMVVIRGGSFLRGSAQGGRDELPRHAVNLSAFALDTHPVTNEQFVRFLEAMGGEKDSNNNDIIRLRESRIKRSAGKLSVESGYAKHPVVGVTWYGAVAYAKWVGKRLPTEAEWEVAAYGGNEENVYPTGEDIERTQANFFSSDTTAVMSYPPNDIGLYDVAGNVYEWCQDWYGYHYYDVSVQEPENPTGPLQGVYRVLRGGCWKSLKEDMRCSHRHRNNPGTMNGTYGFRCAADVS
jgi:formylglycine-generating enzyme required for sulfatase activity